MYNDTLVPINLLLFIPFFGYAWDVSKLWNSRDEHNNDNEWTLPDMLYFVKQYELINIYVYVSIQQLKVKNSAPLSPLSSLCYLTRTNNNVTECFHMLVLGTFGIWFGRVTLDKNSLLQGARRYPLLATHSTRPILTLRGQPPVRIVLLLPLLDNLSFFFNDRFLELKFPGPGRVGLFEQERLTQAWSWVDLNNLASFGVFKNIYYVAFSHPLCSLLIETNVPVFFQ